MRATTSRWSAPSHYPAFLGAGAGAVRPRSEPTTEWHFLRHLLILSGATAIIPIRLSFIELTGLILMGIFRMAPGTASWPHGATVSGRNGGVAQRKILWQFSPSHERSRTRIPALSRIFGCGSAPTARARDGLHRRGGRLCASSRTHAARTQRREIENAL